MIAFLVQCAPSAVIVEQRTRNSLLRLVMCVCATTSFFAILFFAPAGFSETQLRSAAPSVRQTHLRFLSSTPGLLDLTGRAVDAFDLCGARAVVYVFVCTDCPIANRYAPQLQRLQRGFSPQGIAFKLVYAGNEQSPESIARHGLEYGYQWPALRDTRHELVRLTGARITPEAAVVLPSGRVVYRGAIDDRHLGFGQSRTQATQPYLADALQAVLAGRPVPRPQTKAVGCRIPAELP